MGLLPSLSLLSLSVFLFLFPSHFPLSNSLARSPASTRWISHSFSNILKIVCAKLGNDMQNGKFCYSSTFDESLRNSWSTLSTRCTSISLGLIFRSSELLIMITEIDKKKFEFILIFWNLTHFKMGDLCLFLCSQFRVALRAAATQRRRSKASER